MNTRQRSFSSTITFKKRNEPSDENEQRNAGLNPGHHYIFGRECCALSDHLYLLSRLSLRAERSNPQRRIGRPEGGFVANYAPRNDRLSRYRNTL
jgi:hypothetical protein